jgi:23S rRNA pseudouridine1911/1915/1917 synthase
MEQLVFQCSDDQVRLDVEVTSQLSELGKTLSRSQIQRLITSGAVTINGKVCARPGVKLSSGDTINLELCDLLPSYAPSPLSQSLPIVFYDDHIVVINKPAGISVHPGIATNGNTVVEGLIHYLSELGDNLEQNPRLGVVHRIDKDTTGLVVLARTTAALTSLSQQFQEKSATRLYQALVLTSPKGKRRVQLEPNGHLITGYGRHPKNRLKFAVVPESPKKAETHWNLIDDIGYASVLKASLKTGRTHQIRVHLESIGSPVIGDQLYGDFAALPAALRNHVAAFGRQALHAEELQIVHPASGEPMTFNAPLPDDHRELISFFKDYQANEF